MGSWSASGTVFPLNRTAGVVNDCRRLTAGLAEIVRPDPNGIIPIDRDIDTAVLALLGNCLLQCPVAWIHAWLIVMPISTEHSRSGFRVTGCQPPPPPAVSDLTSSSSAVHRQFAAIRRIETTLACAAVLILRAPHRIFSDVVPSRSEQKQTVKTMINAVNAQVGGVPNRVWRETRYSRAPIAWLYRPRPDISPDYLRSRAGRIWRTRRFPRPTERIQIKCGSFPFRLLLAKTATGLVAAPCGLTRNPAGRWTGRAFAERAFGRQRCVGGHIFHFNNMKDNISQRRYAREK